MVTGASARPSVGASATPARVEASSAKVPLGPVVERCSSKPVSLDELSRQLTSIRLLDAATALVFDGAFTVAPVVPTDSAWTAGSTGWLARSHPTQTSPARTTHPNRSHLRKPAARGDILISFVQRGFQFGPGEPRPVGAV